MTTLAELTQELAEGYLRDRDLLERFVCSRTGDLSVLEFGARLSGGAWWLTDFGHLIVLDVDGVALRTARERLRRFEPNVTCHWLANGDQLPDLPPLDILYAHMDFSQHPPPAYVRLITKLARNVRGGGLLLLRLPTRLRNDLVGDETDALLRTLPPSLVETWFRIAGFHLILREEDHSPHLITASSRILLQRH